MKRIFYLTYIRRGASFARFTAKLSARGGKLSVDLDGLSFLGRQFVTEPAILFLRIRRNQVFSQDPVDRFLTMPVRHTEKLVLDQLGEGTLQGPDTATDVIGERLLPFLTMIP